MSFLSDLDHLKIETIFQPDHVCTPGFFSDPRKGIRKAKIEQKWYRKKSLGIGSFGEVWLEEEGSDASQMRAVKVIKKAQMLRHDIDYMRELNTLAHFSKPKYRQESLFVDFFGWYDDDATVYLAMEYFPLGDLDSFIQSAISEGGAREIASQLLQGLCFMHGEGYAHRDLKPGNIFVVQNTPSWWVKIGDFGISKRIADANTAFRTFIGTRDYMGPELFHYLDSQDEDEDEYSNAVDIWAVGCIVFKLIAKKPPFPPGASLRRYCSNQELFPSEVIAACTSPSCVEFLKRLLTPEPVQRPLAREALEESWITSDTSLESSNVGGSVQPTDTHDNRVDVEAKTVRPESGEFPSHGADNETDSTIKHATKNEVNIQGSTVKEASSDYILDHQTVENGLFSEPMDSPGSVEPDVDRARIQNLIAGDKDLDRMVENLNPRRVENINPRMVENIKHGPAARTTKDYFRKPFPEKPAERTPSGNFITPSPAHDTHKKQSPSTRNRKQLPSLPPARELDARIQEARTSAKLLLQFMETYRTDDAVGNGLIREFADRCRSASRSIQAYMISENPAPDGNTLSLLAQTRDDLAVAIFKHSRVFGEPVDAMMTPTSPKTASEGVSRQSESQKPGSLDATRHKMNKSRQKKELQATTDRESRREVGVNRESRGVVGVNTESRGEVGAMGFWKKLSLRLEAPYQNEIKSREAKPSESITASLSDSNAVSPTRKIPETFLGLSAAVEDLRRLRTPGSRQPMGSNSPPENDSDEYFVPVNLSDVWLQVIESGQLYWTHEETGCILFTNPRFAILPPGWAMRTSPFESKPRILYVHHNTQTKSWDFPRHELPEQVLLSFEDQSLAEDWFRAPEETKWVHKSFRVYVEIDPKWPLPSGWVAYDNFTTDQVPVHFFYVFSGARISYDPRSSHIGRLQPSTN